MRRARLVTLLMLGLAVSALAASAPQALSTTLVINEVDYDQASTDAAEYLELTNVSGSAIDLDPYVVQLVNGTGGGATLYDSIDLPASRSPRATTTSSARTQRPSRTAISTTHQTRTSSRTATRTRSGFVTGRRWSTRSATAGTPDPPTPRGLARGSTTPTQARTGSRAARTASTRTSTTRTSSTRPRRQELRTRAQRRRRPRPPRRSGRSRDRLTFRRTRVRTS